MRVTLQGFTPVIELPYALYPFCLTTIGSIEILWLGAKKLKFTGAFLLR